MNANRTVAVVAGALLAALSFSSSHAQEPKKPKQESSGGKKPPSAKVEKKPVPTGVKIVCEWIEVEHREVTGWLMENRLENDATKMRRILQEMIEDGDASVVETMIVASRSGQRAKVESVREIIYPTAFDPSGFPAEVSLEGKAEAPVTVPNPTAFETRNTGVTLEVDPVIAADGKSIDLNLVPEIVEFLGDRRLPHDDTPEEFQVAMPEFYVTKLTTSVSVPNGGYVLLGTVRLVEAHDQDRDDPVVLVFVRADAF